MIDTKKEVKEILESSFEARNNNTELFILFFEKVTGIRLTDIVKERLRQLRFGSRDYTRACRDLQNEFDYLKATESKRKIRKQQEKEYIQEYGAKNPYNKLNK